MMMTLTTFVQIHAIVGQILVPLLPFCIEKEDWQAHLTMFLISWVVIVLRQWLLAVNREWKEHLSCDC